MNPNHILTRSDSPSEVSSFLEDRLYEFNSAQTGQDDGQLFAFVICDDRQEIVAGISGWTWAHVSEIGTLWVHPSRRGQGYGQELLAAAEREAREHGCRIILVSSYTFQAPGFIRSMGTRWNGGCMIFRPDTNIAISSSGSQKPETNSRHFAPSAVVVSGCITSVWHSLRSCPIARDAQTTAR